MNTAVYAKEAVGANYAPELMKYAQARTWEAVDAIAAAIRPGMSESEATAIGKQVLAELGMERIWHPLLIRFGANTLKTFKQHSDGDPLLGANDKHLSFRSSVIVHVPDGDDVRFMMGTRVQCKNAFGRFYMGAIDSVHRHYIAPTMLRKAVDFVLLNAAPHAP